MANTTTNQFGQTNQAANNQPLPFGYGAGNNNQNAGLQMANPLVLAHRQLTIKQAQGNGMPPVINTEYKLTNLKATYIENGVGTSNLGYTIVRGTDQNTGSDIYFNIMNGKDTAMQLAMAMLSPEYKQLNPTALPTTPQVSQDFWKLALNEMNIDVVFVKDQQAKFSVIGTVKFF